MDIKYLIQNCAPQHFSFHQSVQPRHGGGHVLQPGGCAQQEPQHHRRLALLHPGPAGRLQERRRQLPLQALLPRAGRGGRGPLQRVAAGLQPCHRDRYCRVPADLPILHQELELQTNLREDWSFAITEEVPNRAHVRAFSSVISQTFV